MFWLEQRKVSMRKRRTSRRKKSTTTTTRNPSPKMMPTHCPTHNAHENDKTHRVLNEEEEEESHIYIIVCHHLDAIRGFDYVLLLRRSLSLSRTRSHSLACSGIKTRSIAFIIMYATRKTYTFALDLHG